jgi:hypothetical protein
MRAEFVEIDAESETAPGGVAEGRFGPDAILLVGFTPEETKRWRAELVGQANITSTSSSTNVFFERRTGRRRRGSRT